MPSLLETHEMWKESVPAISFPFEYKSKGGTIRHTWKEVKAQCNRDCTSTAMPFCVGHYAPSANQNLIVHQMVMKHHDNISRLEKMIAARSPQETKSQHPYADSRMLTSSRADLLLPIERDALYGGGGGGSNRKNYLRIRRRLPVQQRFHAPLATSQRYGWEQLDRGPGVVNGCPGREEALVCYHEGMPYPEYVRWRPRTAGAEKVKCSVVETDKDMSYLSNDEDEVELQTQKKRSHGNHFIFFDKRGENQYEANSNSANVSLSLYMRPSNSIPARSEQGGLPQWGRRGTTATWYRPRGFMLQKWE